MAPSRHGVRRIVVGLDGSDQAAGALDWAIDAAMPLGAEIVAVYALHVPISPFDPYAVALPLQYDPQWQAAMKRAFEEEWCRPLRESGLRYRMEMREGKPAAVIADVADLVDADLVVVGRRGRGRVAELLLGSINHELAHQCRRPVLLISGAEVAHGRTQAISGVARRRKDREMEVRARFLPPEKEQDQVEWEKPAKDLRPGYHELTRGTRGPRVGYWQVGGASRAAIKRVKKP